LVGYEEQLRSLAGDDKRIVFLGPRYGEELASLFRKAYLFVLPSAVEGLPIALIEALAYGLPVLVSDIPENLEVLEHESLRFGATFKTGCAVSLAEQLAGLVDDPDAVALMGERGRQAVRQKYDWDAIADQTEEVYRGLVAGAYKTAPILG
jgi:glycosyltransferase involved in cell wall biosynthesis